MKRFLLLLAVISLLMMQASAFALETYDDLHVVGCTEWVSLRASDSKEAERLAKVPLRAMVKYLEPAKHGYAHVSYGGKMGYILLDYLSELDPETQEAFTVSMYVANCREYITLRSEPSTKADALAKIPLGAEIECLTSLGDEAEMAQVRYAGQTGYVLKRYLSYVSDDSAHRLTGAEINVVNASGETHIQSVRDEATLKELNSMLQSAQPGYIGKCPYCALLTFKFEDGRTLYFTYPVDGCSDFIAENGEIYNLSDRDRIRFWEIFDEAYASLIPA